jgi:alpha-glucosidase
MHEWWRGGVIYQVYPRSFCDSDNDGVGDLAGVESRLDYLAGLGVDGVWLSPFFKSPMRDFGYDISDYCDVDPVFGDLAGFDRLIRRAHDAGLKVIIDQVWSHTSDQHPWFRESRQSKDNPRADWYVWADGQDDGSPPNNWISLFGGQAWSWDTRRRQYYLHNFLTEQPDLNFHNPAVRAAILDVARFWLERGVDGFRLDVANFYYCDRLLRSNPPKRAGGAGQFARPYWHQRHLYDRSQPENLDFMGEVRRLVDAHGDLMTVAEIGSDDYIGRSIEYTEPGRLHTAYNFMLLENGPFTAGLIRRALEQWTSETAWPSWSFSNHDVVRARTRWGGAEAGDRFARLLIGILLTLRGTIFLYQGDELGLPQADVPFDRLRDPEGIRFWPESLGRDGCRTPMPWHADQPNAGFSTADPWLPVPDAHHRLAVDVQDADPASTLAFTRHALAFRKAHTVLREGSIRFLDLPEPVLGYWRGAGEDEYAGEGEGGAAIACLFNLSAEPQRIALPAGAGSVLDLGLPGMIDGGEVVLPAWGGLALRAR